MEEESSYFMLSSLSLDSDFHMIYSLIVMSIHNHNTLLRKQACSQASVYMPSHHLVLITPCLFPVFFPLPPPSVYSAFPRSHPA